MLHPTRSSVLQWFHSFSGVLRFRNHHTAALLILLAGAALPSACSNDGASSGDDAASSDDAADDDDSTSNDDDDSTSDDAADDDDNSSSDDDAADDDDNTSSDDDADDDGPTSTDDDSSSDDEDASSDDPTSTDDDPSDDSSTDDDAASSDDSSADSCGNRPGQLFPPDAPWNTPVADAPLDDESDAIIAYLQNNHDTGTRFQTDFSIRVLHATDETPHREFTPTDEFYGNECDPAPPPVPEDGALEGESGYACESDGDCHLIVVDHDECRLYEMWRADIRGDEFNGGCQAIWEIDRTYGPEGRGDYCTSADAAGLPIAPLLATADEVFSGEVRHALRFILPNAHIRDDVFVRPGTHSTNAASGPADAPPYAARLRLRADTDLSGLSTGAQVIAQALQIYGMILADGGNLTFTMLSDEDTERSWDEAELTPQDLKSLSWSDFEVVELGERISYSAGDCTRSQITE